MSKKISGAKTSQELLQLKLVGAFAEYHAAIISERIKLGIKRKRESSRREAI